MAIAGTLAVNVIANTKKFVKGISTAQTSLGKFKGTLAKVTKGVTGFGAGLVGVAGVAGFSVFAKSQIESATLLGDTADKLGIATGKLELMRFAAEATGVSTKSLDTALQRMVRRVGQAAQGTGEAAKVLKQFGIDAEALNKLDPAAQFEKIAAGINAIPDKGGQLAAAMAIFDTEGVGLVNTMAQGVNSFAKAFERAGGATASAGIENARKFTFAVQEFKRAVGSTGRDFVLGVTPAALEAIKGLTIIMESLGVIKAAQTAKSKTQAEGRFTRDRGVLGTVLALEKANRQLAVATLAFPLSVLGTDRTQRKRPSVKEFRQRTQQRAETIFAQPGVSAREKMGQLRSLQDRSGTFFPKMIGVLQKIESNTKRRAEPTRIELQASTTL